MNRLHYFNITYLCDSDCLFCAANVGLIHTENYTMTAESFSKALQEEDTKASDRIMISGGEPTLSPYFWEILDECERRKCCIDLTTNGHFFSLEKNIKLLSNYSSVVVRIPVFGIEEYHDYLTGKKGNFEKTIKALDSFCSLVASQKMTVNVKFLLCKATIKSNQEAYDYLFDRYGNNFEYTLSPILISQKVRINESILLSRYSDLICQSQDFINIENLNCDIIPLCLLPHSKLNSFLRKKRIVFEKAYSDAELQHSDMDNYWCDKCARCRLNKYCDRFLPSYINYYGDDEISPFI